MTISTDPGLPYATFNFTLPNATDNSGVTPILWTKPPIEDAEATKMPIGLSEFEIVGVDAFGNTAFCVFSVLVEG